MTRRTVQRGTVGLVAALVAAALGVGAVQAGCRCGPQEFASGQFGNGLPPFSQDLPFAAPPASVRPPVPIPPGTLGVTYQRPSRPIPFDRHPRVGMLDIAVPPQALHSIPLGHRVSMTVQDVRRNFAPLKGFAGADGVWHFESEPLIPGIPHVYDVKAELVRVEQQVEFRWGMEYESEVETPVETLGVWTVRLIPGRVVDLPF